LQQQQEIYQQPVLPMLLKLLLEPLACSLLDLALQVYLALQC
jgi:hypothetical protein